MQCQFSPLARLQSIPCALETNVRENLPTQMWRKPNIQRNGLVNKHNWMWHEGVPGEERGEGRWKGEDQGNFYFLV